MPHQFDTTDCMDNIIIETPGCTGEFKTSSYLFQLSLNVGSWNKKLIL